MEETANKYPSPHKETSEEIKTMQKADENFKMKQKNILFNNDHNWHLRAPGS